MIKPRKTIPRPSMKPENQECLFRDPLSAARHIDSLMRTVQKRYGSPQSPKADLGHFLITKAEVHFASNVQFVTLEKRPESQTLAILSPIVAKMKEDDKRIELLNSFGDLILKFQKQAYLQIRDMLLQILDEDGKKIFLNDATFTKGTQISSCPSHNKKI